MEYMRSRFFKAFDDMVRPSGFKRYHQGYARMVNDVIQGFELVRSSFGHTAYIKFDIFAVNTPFDLTSGIWFETYSLHQLIDRVDFGEKYIPNNHAEMEKCIDLLKNEYTLNLSTFFDDTDSCKTAFPMLLELEKRICGNHEMRPNSSLMNMALRVKEWKYAAKQLDLLLSARKDAMAARKETSGFSPTKEELQVNKELELMLSMIVNKEYDAIEKIIEKNKCDNLQALNIRP